MGSAVQGGIMPAFAVSLSSLIGGFYSPDISYLKHTTTVWCLVLVGESPALLLNSSSALLPGLCRDGCPCLQLHGDLQKLFLARTGLPCHLAKSPCPIPP